ncbi:MAG: cyclic nucleotide-binding domain-containing protein [Spirochaetales bacterium]|nr:cyclic nucleotide-binding domain-containing protein [Spirochaetales bacterium]
MTKKNVTQGTVLLLQGERQKAVNLLHSGLAELLCSNVEVNGLKPDEIIGKSRRVGLLKGESIYGIPEGSGDTPYRKSVRALTDCVISVIPSGGNDFFGELEGKAALSLQVLRSIVSRITFTDFLLTGSKSLWSSLNKVADGIALSVNLSPPGRQENPVSERAGSSLSDYASHVKKRYASKGLQPSMEWDPNVLSASADLGTVDESEKIRIDTIIDYPQFLFFKRLLAFPDGLLAPILKKDKEVLRYLHQFLSGALFRAVGEYERISNTIYKLIHTLFSANGWLAQALKAQGLHNQKALRFNHYLGKYSLKFRKDILQLFGMDLKTAFPVYTNLESFSRIDAGTIEAKKQETVRGAGIQATESPEISGSAFSKYTNLLARILQFAEMGDSFNADFVGNLRSFKKFENKFENVPKLNSLKRRIATAYWRLYEKCILKVITGDLKKFIPGIMLHFGVLDETLVSKTHLHVVDQAFMKNLHTDATIPVMTLPYFLEKIYKEHANPSLTEMGESFKDLLKKQEKIPKKKLEEEYRDAPEDKIRFEIRKVISSAYRMVFGSVATAFPILCSNAILGPPGKLFLEAEQWVQIINNLRQRDFSMFYREVVIHHKYGSDIIKKEVIPNFVMYPVYGTKMLMWQELDGPKRDSMGRLFLPVLFNGDKYKSLLAVIGHFRWELHRLIAGANWMNPVEGGLTGAYYDYINFYKKNPNLTPEAKLRVKEFVKKTRSDKDRFTRDYMSWVIYEFDGIPKHNPVSREIFYKFCPFKKNDRDRLSQRPVFLGIEMKYQNIIKRQMLKIESRIRKYEKAGEPVPTDLIRYMEFLHM